MKASRTMPENSQATSTLTAPTPSPAAAQRHDAAAMRAWHRRWAPGPACAAGAWRRGPGGCAPEGCSRLEPSSDQITDTLLFGGEPFAEDARLCIGMAYIALPFLDRPGDGIDGR